MKKVKIWYIALLSTALAFITMLTLSCFSILSVRADTPADIEMNIASSANGGMTASVETVDGKEVTAYGCTGWGNVLTYFTLDRAYDASAIYETGKGAIVFWIDFADEITLNAYKNASGNFNVDVSSGPEYSDAHKYSFVINSVFSDCVVGWNKILLPFVAAAEKNDMDWSNVYTVRLNGTGSGIADGASNLKFARFTATTTEEESMQVVREREIPADVELNIASSANNAMNATTETVDGKEVTAYGCTGWGGVLTVFSLDRPYDASRIFETGKGALTFWMYFADDASLAAYKAMEGNFIVDVSSRANYADGDSYKYAFEISSLFDRCKTGWNQILLPLATAAEKKDGMDWSSVQSIRLNGTGSAVADGASNLKFASFAFTVSEEARMTVLTDTENIALTVSSAQDFGMTTENIGEMQVTAYGCVDFGWGGFVQVLTLDRYYDVRAIVDTNMGAFVFWLYIADDETLAAYQAVTDFWTLDVCSSVNFNDINKYTFMISPVFGDCVVGWNKIVLPLATAAEKNSIDWSKVRTLRLNCGGTTLTAGKNNVRFAEFGFTVTEDTSMRVTQTVAAQTGGGDEDENLDPIDELVIIDCNSASGTYFTGNKVDKEDFRYGTGCVYTSGAGYGLTATDVEVGRTDLRKNTIVLAMWIWIEDIALFDAAGVNGQIELSSSNAFDKNEIFWENWWVGLESGWNWLVLRGTDASVSGGLPDFDNLKRVRIYVNNIAQSTLKIDRITIGNVENTALFEEPDWENEKANSGVFKGANGYAAENDTYIEVDFGAAEGFTVLERETVTVTDGSGNVVLGVTIGVVLILAAVVVTVILVKKRRRQ